MPIDEELRLECLRLAITNCTGASETIVDDARAFYNFLTGQDAKTTRERTLSALDEANVR